MHIPNVPGLTRLTPDGATIRVSRPRGRRLHEPCLHAQCHRCFGTGVDDYGNPCVHALVCSCSKCGF